MNHVIIVDLGYGDSGKGSIADWVCSPGGAGFAGGRPVQAVVRFNGGAQAAHNVVTTDGRHHTFAQFGSGTFTPGVRTHLSRFMLVDPLALAAEAAHLASAGVGDALDRLTVDRDALLTTPYHRAANRARELARGVTRHGSCGVGIGETARYALEHPGDAPRVADCAAPQTLARSLRRLRDRLADELGPLEAPPVADVCDAYRAFAERVALVDGGYLGRLLRTGPVVFEGAQGVLLDEWRGFHPFTTWSTTTFANAETLLAEAGGTALRLGVVRCYLTRHGPGLVEDALATPVALTSYGPTTADKRAVASALPPRTPGPGSHYHPGKPGADQFPTRFPDAGQRRGLARVVPNGGLDDQRCLTTQVPRCGRLR